MLKAKRKIIIDQDAHGPASTNLQSIMMLLQAPDVEVLGICVMSGDGWCEENAMHTLRLLEIMGRRDVPVFKGAAVPLINSFARTQRWEQLYGPLFWKGCWTTHFHDGSQRPGEHHDKPFYVPLLLEGMPTISVASESAAEFMVRTVKEFPGEVSIWEGGPMTNLALAARLDPEFAGNAKELFYMGGSHRPAAGSTEFSLEYKYCPRLEFNMRWDPEAASLVLHEPWRSITQVPVDATTKAFWTRDMAELCGKADTPWAWYLRDHGRECPMWDEVAAALWIDPSLATQHERMMIDVDVSFTANYGGTLSWELGRGPGMGEQAVDVIKDIDLERVYALTQVLLCGRPK